MANHESDTDLKTIFVPDLNALILNRVEHTWKTEVGTGRDKVEHTHMSLQHFLGMAANGDELALSLLHSGPSHWSYSHSYDMTLWLYLHEHRARFYTRAMSKSLAFAAGMASKYATRAARLAVVEDVIKVLWFAEHHGLARVRDCWAALPPEGPYVRHLNHSSDRVDSRIYEVCGKGLPAAASPATALATAIKLRDSFGARVKAAHALDGNDWKSLHHAYRVGYQLLHTYQDGGFSYPLPETDFLRAVKNGELDFAANDLGGKLDALITQVESMAAVSTYPETVDQAWLDAIILYAYGRGDLPS